MIDLCVKNGVYFINAVVAVLLFFLGYVVNCFVQKNSKKKELSLYKKIVVEWWNVNMARLDVFISSLKKLINDINTNDEFDAPIWIINLINVFKIEELPLSKLTEALVIDLDSEEDENLPTKLIELFNNLEFIKQKISETEKNYVDYRDSLRKVVDEWNSCYSLFLQSFQKLISDQYLDQDNRNILETIQSKFDSYQSAKSLLVSNWENDLLPFINKMIVKLQCNNHQNDIESIRTAVSRMLIVIVKYRKLNSYSENFQSSIQTLLDTKINIDKTIQFYNSHELKGLCGIK